MVFGSILEHQPTAGVTSYIFWRVRIFLDRHLGVRPWNKNHFFFFFFFWFLQIWDPVTGCMALSGWPDSTDCQLIITTPDSSLEHRDLTNIWCIWRIQELDSVLLFFWIVDCTSSSNGSGAVGVFVSVLLTYHNSVKSTIPHRHQVITVCGVSLARAWSIHGKNCCLILPVFYALCYFLRTIERGKAERKKNENNNRIEERDYKKAWH